MTGAIVKQAADIDVRAGGARLRARWFAPRADRDQPVIVLLHQGLGSLSQWRDFPALLASATDHAVVAYDRQGHGGSDPVSGPRQPDFLDVEAREVLPAVLEALGIARPILYGHSDGGSIALLFAAAFPRVPRAVISEAAHVVSEVGSTDGMAAVGEAFRSGDLRARLARHHGDKVDSMFNAWIDVWTSPAMRAWSMEDRLPAIVCPVLLVQGTDDEHGTLRQIETIEQTVSGTTRRWLVPACGHMPHLERPAEVAAQVGAFLDGIDRR